MEREDLNRSPKRCHKCRFFAKLGGTHEICDYINITKEPRIDPVSEKCTKFEPKGRKRHVKN